MWLSSSVGNSRIMIRIRRIGMNTYTSTDTQTAETPTAEVITAPAPNPRPIGPTQPPTPTPAPAPDPRTQGYHYKLRREPAMNAQQSALYFLGLWVQALVLGYEKPMHQSMTTKFINQLIDEKLALLKD